MVTEKDDTVTTALLQEVVTRLSLRSLRRNKYTISTDSTHGFIMSEAEKQLTETIRNHFVKILAEISGAKPNDLSILFAVTDFILKQFNACTPFVEDSNEDWIYKSEVRGYQYINHVLEISILMENDVQSTMKYHYMCFNFPEGKHIYHVEEIPVTWIPTFAVGQEENDQISIQYLCVTIAQVFDSFCGKFVERGKFRSREFSLRGIKPIFSDSTKCSSGQPSKKRKKTIPVSPYDMTKLKPVIPIFYGHLCDLFKKMGSKPNAHSRLFAVLYKILTYACACKTTKKNDEWPGGLTYNSDVIQVWFPDGVQYYIFNLSLLKNEKEFYCCLRFTADHTKKYIGKLNDTLVPTFNPSETQKDVERIHNLNLWLLAIIKSFIRKVIAESYSSQNISFVSLASTASQSQDASSADENE